MKIEALYLHIPFCLKKCNYCDFTSYPVGDYSLQEYCRAVKKEAALYLDKGFGQDEINSLYVGGGTPSVISAEDLADLISYLKVCFSFAKHAEITVECNPGTVDTSYFRVLRKSGVNRISLGAQAFQKSLLRAMGRIHGPEDIVRAVASGREAGFDNINLDLMYGLPEQSLSQWAQSLERACALRVPHISAYGLKMEENTPWGRKYQQGDLAVPDGDISADMFETAISFLSGHGYIHYEISNFARHNWICRHNIVYWKNGIYLGIGAGAASHWGNIRQVNYMRVDQYCMALKKGLFPVYDRELLDQETVLAESIFLGLRMMEGLDTKEFYQQYGIQLEKKYQTQIEKLLNQGLLDFRGSRIRLTSRGIFLANEVFMEFLPVLTHE